MKRSSLSVCGSCRYTMPTIESATSSGTPGIGLLKKKRPATSALTSSMTSKIHSVPRRPSASVTRWNRVTRGLFTARLPLQASRGRRRYAAPATPLLLVPGAGVRDAGLAAELQVGGQRLAAGQALLVDLGRPFRGDVEQHLGELPPLFRGENHDLAALLHGVLDAGFAGIAVVLGDLLLIDRRHGQEGVLHFLRKALPAPLVHRQARRILHAEADLRDVRRDLV